MQILWRWNNCVCVYGQGLNCFPIASCYPSALLQADTESIRFEIIAKGRASAAIDRATIINTVRGMKVKDANDWLSRNLSLTRDPRIDLRSDTFNMERIPLFAFRIQVDVAQ